MDDAFRSEMAVGYTFDEPVIVLGAPMLGDELAGDLRVCLPLSRVNRHGLVAGATGTGKTTTLQVLAGALSAAGVPVFAVDVKGDLSGIGAPGDPASPPVAKRVAAMGWDYKPLAHPVQVLSLSGRVGAHVRASVSSFGPLLLGKVLDLNDTQVSVLSLVFHYCDQQKLPLLDLADLRTTLKYLGSDDGKAALEDLGGISPATLGVILRAIVTLEQDGSAVFFGEPEFEVDDLLRTAPDGQGVISLLEVADVMDRPRLYATFVLWLLARLYDALPEVGDQPKPRLAFFFDEAHLLFRDASSALLEQIERTARLIRSKGVGVFFVTQAPTDVPSSVLSQLGNRIQHALRAFTPDDADALRKTARTFPVTRFYDVEKTITSLGIGEALVTVLSPKGVPTPLAATKLLPPDSRMAALTADELAAVASAGPLTAKYGQAIDPESAHEIITARLAAAHAQAAGEGVPGAAHGPVMSPPMTPAQQRRAAEQAARAEVREAAQQCRAAEQASQQAARDRRAEERSARAAERERQRTMQTVARTTGRVITSPVGQSLLRGLFATLGKRMR